jgi:hypothetical protein
VAGGVGTDEYSLALTNENENKEKNLNTVFFLTLKDFSSKVMACKRCY